MRDGTTRRALEPFRRLTVQDWVWLHFKVAVITWAAVLWRFTPAKVGSAVGWLIAFAAIVTIVGGILSATALIVAAWSRRAAIHALAVEYSALWLMAAGPISYFGIQVWLSATLPDGDQRYALSVHAYVLCAVIAARIVIVYRRRRRTLAGA